MNIEEAKQLPIIDLMSRMGYEVQYIERQGTEHVYYSPIREEKTPSFKVNNRKNVFYDFGHGEGAGIIDLSILILESRGAAHSVKDALSFLSSLFGQSNVFDHQTVYKKPLNKSFSFTQQEKYNAGQLSKIQFVKTIPIKNPVIFEYLESRGVTKELANKYLQEIHYKNLGNNRQYFGFGMANLSGGFEIRSASDNANFKSAIKRDLSLIQNTKQNSTLNIFEGMIDALSFLKLTNSNKFDNDTVILHSLSSFRRCCDYIVDHEYQSLNLYLDNNPSGRKTTNKYYDFGEQNNIEVIDESHLYLPYEDINDALRVKDVRVLNNFSLLYP